MVWRLRRSRCTKVHLFFFKKREGFVINKRGFRGIISYVCIVIVSMLFLMMGMTISDYIYDCMSHDIIVVVSPESEGYTEQIVMGVG